MMQRKPNAIPERHRRFLHKHASRLAASAFVNCVVHGRGALAYTGKLTDDSTPEYWLADQFSREDQKLWDTLHSYNPFEMFIVGLPIGKRFIWYPLLLNPDAAKGGAE